MAKFLWIAILVMLPSMLMAQEAGEEIKVGGIVVVPLKSKEEGTKVETDLETTLKSPNDMVTFSDRVGGVFTWRTEKKGILLPGEYVCGKTQKIDSGLSADEESFVWLSDVSPGFEPFSIIEIFVLDHAGMGKVRYFQLEQSIKDSLASAEKWVKETESLKSDKDKRRAALSMLTFTGFGNTHRVGPFKKTVRNLVGLLLKSEKDSKFSGDVYTNELCIMAVCELYAISRYQDLKDVCKRTVDELLKMRAKDGGWGKKPEAEKSTLEETCMGAVTLKYAKYAGLTIEKDVLDATARRVRDWYKGKGVFSAGAGTELQASAGAPLALIQCGVSKEDEDIQKTCEYLASKYKDIAKDEKTQYMANYSLFLACHGSDDTLYGKWLIRLLDSNPPEEVKGENDLYRILTYEAVYRTLANTHRHRIIKGEYGGVVAPSLRLAMLASEKEGLTATLAKLTKKVSAKENSYAAIRKALGKKTAAAAKKLDAAFGDDCCGYLVALPDGRMMLEMFDGTGLFARYRKALLESLAVESALAEKPPEVTKERLASALNEALKVEPPESDDLYGENEETEAVEKEIAKKGVGIKSKSGAYIYRFVPVAPGK